jgi:cell pole-organizing protein PopZ
MSEKPTTDPTMDEILASIRRIISEDPAPQEAAAAPEPEPEVSAAAALEVATPAAAPEPQAPADHSPVAQAAEESIQEEAMTDTHASADEPLVGEAAASASASAFDALAATAEGAASAAHPPIALPAPGRTLEDLTGELLRPLLKAWLDENLADIVRDRVDEEVRRIARNRVR